MENNCIGSYEIMWKQISWVLKSCIPTSGSGQDVSPLQPISHWLQIKTGKKCRVTWRFFKYRNKRQIRESKFKQSILGLSFPVFFISHDFYLRSGCKSPKEPILALARGPGKCPLCAGHDNFLFFPFFLPSGLPTMARKSCKTAVVWPWQLKLLSSG